MADAWGSSWGASSAWGNTWVAGTTATSFNPLQILSLKLSQQLALSISVKGNLLPLTLLSAAPSGTPPAGKGLVGYLSGDDFLLATWDSSNSAWVKTNFNDLIRSSSGELRIGGAANYTAIEADGTIELNGDATVWDDIRINPGSFDRPGDSDPAIVAYAPNGGGISTYVYEFALNNIAAFTVQLPHSYKTGSDIYCHLHWTPGARGNEENGNTVGWKVDYSWASIGGNFGDMATLDLSDACDGTDHKHQMTTDAVISGTGQGISSMLLCNVKRTDTGTDDTWATNTAGNMPKLLEIDFHFEVNTLGSRQRTSK